LRFPGFEEEWEQITLGDCSISLDYGMNAAAKSFDGINKYIRITDIDENTLRYKSENPVSPSGNIDDKYLVGENDILFARTGASTGKSYLYHFSDGKLYFAGFLIRAKIKNEYNSKFIFSQFQTKKYDKWVELMSMRSGQPGINSQEYSSFILFLPSVKKEQDKIASFISLIDERIETQSKIIRELNVLKTNALKRIFSQDLRFKNNDGNNYPNWEEKRLKDLFIFKTTNSFSREKLNYENGKVKNIHYGDIHTKFQTLFDMEREQVPYINSNIDINKINEDNYCKVGDIIFADASEDLKDVGKSIEIINLNNQKILAGLHTLLARPTINTFSIGFCGHLFASDIVRMQIQKESQGSKVLSISAIRLSNISLSVPDLEEQSKITNFLSSIDSKIDIENQLLQKLEEQKKFLLYQMFV
jgi:type I restriction enzyme S subunit